MKDEILLFWEDRDYTNEYIAVASRVGLNKRIVFSIFDNRDLKSLGRKFSASLEIDSYIFDSLETLDDVKNAIDVKLKERGYILLSKEESNRYKILL